MGTVSLSLSEAEVTGVEILAEKIACSLVLEGLYSWWLQRRLVYSPLVSGVAEQTRQRIQTIPLQLLMSSGPSRLYWPPLRPVHADAPSRLLLRLRRPDHQWWSKGPTHVRLYPTLRDCQLRWTRSHHQTVSTVPHRPIERACPHRRRRNPFDPA